MYIFYERGTPVLYPGRGACTPRKNKFAFNRGRLTHTLSGVLTTVLGSLTLKTVAYHSVEDGSCRTLNTVLKRIAQKKHLFAKS